MSKESLKQGELLKEMQRIGADLLKYRRRLQSTDDIVSRALCQRRIKSLRKEIADVGESLAIRAGRGRNQIVEATTRGQGDRAISHVIRKRGPNDR